MTRPQAIVFDLGGVLIAFDYRIAMRSLLPRMTVQPEHLWRLLEQTPLLHDYESGRISTPEFFKAVQNQTGFSGTFEEFRDSFVSMFQPIPAMVTLHAELRSKGYRTYVLSNTNEMATAYFKEQFPFFNQFDGYAFSFDPTVRTLKPAPPIYEKIEELSGLQGADLFYMDDIPQYVEAARRRGWQAIVHVSEAATRAALIEAGILA